MTARGDAAAVLSSLLFVFTVFASDFSVDDLQLVSSASPAAPVLFFLTTGTWTGLLLGESVGGLEYTPLIT